ncbi:MAG TPA: hypothetical protein VFR67_01800 [Pilimelia sp.]|nr:hypothetical protein [Pilimelia sp.]
MDVNWFTGGHSMTVGGQPASKSGRRTYHLPTTDGHIVQAKVRRSFFFDVYPTVDVAGTAYRLGPPTPVALRVVMLLPLILFAGAAIGAAIGMAAIFVNAAILRASVSTGAKIALMIVVLGIAAVLWLVVAVALQVAIS